MIVAGTPLKMTPIRAKLLESARKKQAKKDDQIGVLMKINGWHKQSQISQLKMALLAKLPVNFLLPPQRTDQDKESMNFANRLSKDSVVSLAEKLLASRCTSDVKDISAEELSSDLLKILVDHNVVKLQPCADIASKIIVEVNREEAKKNLSKIQSLLELERDNTEKWIVQRRTSLTNKF